MKVPRRFVDGELYMHVHKKLKMNQNEDVNNYRSLWQKEWYHLLTFILCRIASCFEWQLSLHVMSSSKHIAPNLYESNQQWQYPPSLKIIFGDDNIRLFSCVVGENVKSLSLYVSSSLWCDSYNGISKCIMGYSALTPAWAT